MSLNSFLISVGPTGPPTGHLRRRDCLPFSGVFPPLRTETHKVDGFFIQPRPLVAVPKRVTDDPPDDARSEIIRIVETIHRGHHFFLRKIRICDMRKLVAAAVG